MKKFKKLVATALVAVMVLTTMALSASAGIVYWHGNEGSRCYAKTTQDTTTELIGAKITWQVGSGDVKEGTPSHTTGAEAKSISSWLKFRSGKSFGYYYINNRETHRSTAWMPFNF